MVMLLEGFFKFYDVFKEFKYEEETSMHFKIDFTLYHHITQGNRNLIAVDVACMFCFKSNVMDD